VVFLNGKLMTW